MTYVDTSALIAFADTADSFHPLFRRLFASPPPRTFTTSLVISEGHAWFLRRFDIARALQFVGMVEDMSFLEVMPVGQAELSDATRVLRRFSDQDLTLVDAVGLHLMHAREATNCWSTDHHMSLTGVNRVTSG